MKNEYALLLDNDPAAIARERKQLRALWRECKATNPTLCRQLQGMSDEQLERFGIGLLEQMPPSEKTEYQLRLARELAAFRAQPRPRIAQRKLKLPTPSATPDANPLARFFKPDLMPPPVNPENAPTAAPGPNNVVELRAYGKAFHGGRELGRGVHWVGHNGEN